MFLRAWWFRVGSAWSAPIGALGAVYEGDPAPSGASDFTVRLEAERPWRRWVRPSVAIRGDYTLPDAAPLSLEHGLLAAEMGMNLQMALGQKRYLLLHASRSEEHTSELQSLMRISYAVFCLKKKTIKLIMR